MSQSARLLRTLLAGLALALPTAAQLVPLALPAEVVLEPAVQPGQSFSLRVAVRMEEAPAQLPSLLANKDWEAGAVRDFTSNNAYGWGRESDGSAGFALSVLPDGAWSLHAGDGAQRIDHRPEAADQGIADGRWHEIGFALDREQGVALLFHDGRRVGVYDLGGLRAVHVADAALRMQAGPWELSALRVQAGVLSREQVEQDFVERFGEGRRPAARPRWDGRPLRVLAWNIWHGGRRKGRDEGVQRVVEVIEESGADLVLMQETYGSGARISGRLGFDFYLRSSNLSVLSRFPIREVHRLGPAFRFGGATIELRPGVDLQAYSLWIHYLPSVGNALAEGASGAELEAADEPTRGSEMRAILSELLPHLERTPEVPVLVGGDFNSGSHLDWTQAAASQPNHAGRVVAWPAGLAMARAGFVDTFRRAHPDPVLVPGRTWSPEFVDSHQDRIDYVYARGPQWRVLESRVLDEHPRGWPSDHAAVLSTLALDEPLRVLSYNIKHGRGNDGRIELERAARVIEALEPDVVTLQEVDENCGRSGGVDQAAWLGERLGMHARFGPFMDYDGGRYGMALLSRHPIQSWENLVLPPGAEPRSALAARVRLASGRELVVVGIHLYASEQERLAQAQRVIERFVDEEVPVILAGDFNSAPGSPVMRAFEAHWVNPDKGEDRFTFHAAEPRSEIDYVLVRGGEGVRVRRVDVIDEPLVSDHRPLVLDLLLGH